MKFISRLFQPALLAVIGLSFQFLAQGATGVSISPPTVTNDYAGAITVAISGLTNGQTVRWKNFLIGNANGGINSDEPSGAKPHASPTDGQTRLIGGQRDINVPGDEEPL